MIDTNLRSVQVLNLAGNLITILPKETMSSLPSVLVLNLGANLLENLPPGALEGLPSLRLLLLDRNRLRSFGHVFGERSQLELLNISFNALQEIDYSALPVNLQHLDASRNFVSRIRGGPTDTERLAIQHLELSHNRFTELTSSMLPKYVRVVNLEHNNIASLGFYALHNKVNLSAISLRYNSIKSFSEPSIRLSNIDKGQQPQLLLSNNLLECTCTLAWITLIGKLQKRGSYPRIVGYETLMCRHPVNNMSVQIASLPESEFFCNYMDYCPHVCYCCDFTACDCEIVCPADCTCLHNSDWTTNIVKCTEQNLTDMPFDVPMTVTKLFMDGNSIPVVFKHSLIGRDQLIYLHMNHSGITVIENGSFAGVYKLQVLHLQGNQLVNFSGYEFSELTSLVKLFLHDNLLEYIASSTFSSLSKLKVITLHNNRLGQISADLFQVGPQLTALTIAGNPLRCNCQPEVDVTEWLQSLSDVILDVNNTFCSLQLSQGENLEILAMVFNVSSCPLNVSDTTENSVSVTELQNNGTFPQFGEDDSQSNFYLYLIIAFVLMILFVTAIVIVMCRFCHDIKVRLHARYGWRVAGVPFEDYHKKYDAFISYSTQDELFVLEEFVHRLEPQFKLALHYREFPSARIADAVMEGANKSRRFIIFVTENFLHYEWKNIEAKSAHQQVLWDARNKVILVILTDRPADKFDTDMRLYMKSKTCMMWSDPIFWDKLYYAFPDIKRLRQLNNGQMTTEL